MRLFGPDFHLDFHSVKFVLLEGEVLNLKRKRELARSFSITKLPYSLTYLMRACFFIFYF